MKNQFLRLNVLAAAVLTAATGLGQAKQPEYLEFPPILRSVAPHDVNQALQKKLTDDKQLAEVQRLFEILSWQNFIALNWPHSADGKSRAKIGEKGQPAWLDWKEAFEVYKKDGSKPAPWGMQELPSFFNFKPLGRVMVLFRTGKATALNQADVDDEINQAFTAPIWDQNGQQVRYEALMNKIEVDYLVANELYNIQGQVAFSDEKKTVAFPAASRQKDGAVEVKLAWKVLDPKKDIVERYFTQEAYVANEDKTFTKALMGMVGMHISMKTKSSPQWIWATFEHVDNVETNSLDKIHGKQLKPSFYNQDCDICPINRLPGVSTDYSDSVVKKNQIQRVLPITKATQQLNQQVQRLLGANKSVLQYYELIGSQWPTDPSSPPYYSGTGAPATQQLPEAVTNKPGGKPTPVYLTNMVMETYFQGASDTGPTPPANYNFVMANGPANYQIQGAIGSTSSNTKLIFSTESCMGCHFSGSIATAITKDANGNPVATYGNPGAADFSWLLQLKAHFKK